jgi:hypothetical protein
MKIKRTDSGLSGLMAGAMILTLTVCACSCFTLVVAFAALDAHQQKNIDLPTCSRHHYLSTLKHQPGSDPHYKLENEIDH